MVVAALEAVISGESPEIIKEIIASYIGMDYWEKIIGYKPREHRRDDRQYSCPCRERKGDYE